MGGAGSSFEVCVIGGGLAGLSTAYYLTRLGVSGVVVLEGRGRFGGLLASEEVRGFTFDTGGSHIMFSRSASTLKEMISLLNAPVITHRRNSKVLYGGTYVKYPFEVGLGALPPQERFECLKGVIEAYVRRAVGGARQPSNFLEWIRYVFGDAIAEKYLIPYNEKLWKTDLRSITLEWVGGRVPNPPLDDVIRAAVGLDVEAYKHQLIFSYPARGGIEALIRSLTTTLRGSGVTLLSNAPAKSVTPRGSGLEVTYGEGLTLRCGAVVYTAPLSRSEPVLKDVLGRLATELRRLKSISLVVTGVGIKDGVAPPYHWIYFPGRNVVFHRVGVLSNYSPANAPPNSVALIAETSVRDPASNVKAIERSVIEGLEGVGLVRGGRVDVVRSWVWRDAYVLYDRERGEVLSKVLPALRSSRVFPHGRFGSWSYLNMDAVIESSWRLARELAQLLSNGRSRA